jgi:hypothetical protein
MFDKEKLKEKREKERQESLDLWQGFISSQDDDKKDDNKDKKKDNK